MKKLKLNALQFSAGEVLTRAQLKNVMGGDGSSAGSGDPCCMHTANWLAFDCTYSTQAQAHTAADEYASTYGDRTYYCCNCAGSPGYPY